MWQWQSYTERLGNSSRSGAIVGREISTLQHNLVITYKHKSLQTVLYVLNFFLCDKLN